MNTLAVVIGNNDYYPGYELTKAINDAKAISDIFKRLGYAVIYKENISVRDSEELLREFDTRLPEYDASIFYFAGHGFQVEGENYLATIECQIGNAFKQHCNFTCITLASVLDILRKNSNKVNIVIIDACRRTFDRGLTSAFSPIQAPKGTLIAFSTSPNEGAKDGGLGDNSIYTGALLRYIGRVELPAEELFKKVRKTVYNLTDGGQTPWEHTSLIGDFYFNTGQMVHSLDIPYDTTVVKDSLFRGDGSDFSQLILSVKSYNWEEQNEAIDEALSIRARNLDKNQQFLLGRNLLQAASGNAFSALRFFENLTHELQKYDLKGENHLFNGILFEVYFNSRAEFRKRNLKSTGNFNTIMDLRKLQQFDKSFEFIKELILPYKDSPIWIPEKRDSLVDADITAFKQKTKNHRGKEIEYDIITRIMVLSRDITREISRYGLHRGNEAALKNAIANFVGAPSDLVEINCSISLEKIAFVDEEENDRY